jgi:hypothetical protein
MLVGPSAGMRGSSRTRKLGVGDGKGQLRSLTRLAPVELGIDHQETLIVLGDCGRVGEGWVRKALVDLAAREVFGELYGDYQLLLVVYHVQGLVVEQKAVAVGRRLAAELGNLLVSVSIR